MVSESCVASVITVLSLHEADARCKRALKYLPVGLHFASTVLGFVKQVKITLILFLWQMPTAINEFLFMLLLCRMSGTKNWGVSAVS